MGNNSINDLLSTTPIGAELDSEEIRTLAAVITIQQLDEQDTLIEEGLTDDALYIVVKGSLIATRSTGGNDYVTLHTLHTGDIAGAMGFIDGSEHSATLKALRETEVYVLKREAFESLLESHPKLVYKVMRSIIRTVHSTLLRMNRQFVEMNNYIMKEHGRY
jgi:CRP-like cAMP-binding protein